MDYQNRIGSKKGSGGVASQEQSSIKQKQRISQILNVSNDPYFTKNHLGQYECKLCFTIHTSNESYLNHVNGRKHSLNLQRRTRLDGIKEQQQLRSRGGEDSLNKPLIKDSYTKIGKPSYKLNKIRDVETMEVGVFISVQYEKAENSPEIRFMSCFENSKDIEKNVNFQYLIINCKPYENIGFKIPSGEISNLWKYWDSDVKEYYVQILYKSDKTE